MRLPEAPITKAELRAWIRQNVELLEANVRDCRGDVAKALKADYEAELRLWRAMQARVT